jgi:hypothetical protein
LVDKKTAALLLMGLMLESSAGAQEVILKDEVKMSGFKDLN